MRRFRIQLDDTEKYIAPFWVNWLKKDNRIGVLNPAKLVALAGYGRGTNYRPKRWSDL